MDIEQAIVEPFSRYQKTSFVGKPLGSLHEYYLVGDIEGPEEYVEWFDQIRNCGPNDVVKIHINSTGGDLYTAIQFLRVVSECEGTVINSVEGACMSAATLIFMNADGYEVSPHSVFMFHNYSTGMYGKGGELYDSITHERKWSENLLRELYKGFLTEEEIQAILDNKDIWMDGDEVATRIANRAENNQDVKAQTEKNVAAATKTTSKRRKKSES